MYYGVKYESAAVQQDRAAAAGPQASTMQQMVFGSGEVLEAQPAMEPPGREATDTVLVEEALLEATKVPT